MFSLNFSSAGTGFLLAVIGKSSAGGTFQGRSGACLKVLKLHSPTATAEGKPKTMINDHLIHRSWVQAPARFFPVSQYGPISIPRANALEYMGIRLVLKMSHFP